MAWRGIGALYYKSKQELTSLYINPMAGFNLSSPTWVDCEVIDQDENGGISPLWRNLQKNEDAINAYINSKPDLSLFKIEGFKCNNSIVSIEELFGYKGTTRCIFKNNNNRNSLLIVGTKIIKEQQMCGFVKGVSKTSFCPLIIRVLNGKFSVLNAI